MNRKNKQEVIDHILDYFDFNTASEMMRCNEHFWINEEDDFERVSKLRQFCRKNIRKALEEVEARESSKLSMSTGGFKWAVEVEDGEYFVCQSFIGAEWDNY